MHHKPLLVLPSCSSTTSQFIDGLKVLAHTISVQEKLLCRSIWDLWFMLEQERETRSKLCLILDCLFPMTESWISPQLLATMCATTTIKAKWCVHSICVRTCLLQQPLIKFDHNTTSTTATDALHGTRILLFQHPNSYGGHEHREHPTLAQKSTSKKLSDLPQSYATVSSLMPMKNEEGCHNSPN